MEAIMDAGAAAAAKIVSTEEIIDNESEERRLIQMDDASKSSAPQQQQAPELAEEVEVARDSGAGGWSLGNSSLVSLALWSIVAAGIQFGWALQLSLLTPYIQTLGIEHSFSSFIWLCGPVTGLIVQPCVGVWSDKCQSKWGRRRPFIFIGAVMVCFAVMLIGFAADIGYLIGDTHQSCKVYKGLRPYAAGVFILGFWMLDVANNTVQGPARALLADLAGPDQRNTANAIFCTWIAIGNILGFATGAGGHWHRWFPFLKSKACCEACGNLKAAFLLAVLFLMFCTAITLMFSHEIPLPKTAKAELAVQHYAPLFPDERSNSSKELELATLRTNDEVANGATAVPNGKHETAEETMAGPAAVLVNLLMGIRQLPASMRGVLLVMTLSWLSWFPFFLFDTDWMGREVYHGDPKGGAAKGAAYQRGVQEGAFGLLLNSVVLGVSSLLISPLCRWVGAKALWATSNFIVFVCMVATAIISALASVSRRSYGGEEVPWIKDAAVVLFAILGFPLAVTYSVPFSITAELTADNGGGQGLAMGILNLSVVVPQMVVALGAGPWDAVFGGGNEPAFALAAVFALLAGVVAILRLPRLSAQGYQRAELHGFG